MLKVLWKTHLVLCFNSSFKPQRLIAVTLYTWWFCCACQEKAPSREVEFQEYFSDLFLWRAPISCANEQLHHDSRHISFNDCSIMIIRKLVLQLQPENGWKKSQVAIHSLISKNILLWWQGVGFEVSIVQVHFLGFLVKLIPSCAGPLGNLQIKCVEANVSHWKTWFESHSQRHDSKEASTLVAPQYKRRTKTPCCQPWSYEISYGDNSSKILGAPAQQLWL